MGIGNHALHPVLSFRAEAWPHHDLSTDEVLLDQVPEPAPEAVDVRKLYQVFSSTDVGAGERMLRCAAKHEALSKEGTHVQLRVGPRFTRQDPSVIFACEDFPRVLPGLKCRS